MARFPFQNIDFRFPLVDTETGRVTEYFQRQLFMQTENGEELDGDVTVLAAAVEAINGTVFSAGTGLSGGGVLGTDDPISFALDASLGDLNDVDITTTPPTDGQTIVWDDANSIFIPGEAGGGGSGGAAFIGARAVLTSDQTAVNATGGGIEIDFDATDFDTSSFWSALTPKRLTIPVGVTRVELTGYIYVTAWTGQNYSDVVIRHYDSSDTLLAEIGDRQSEYDGTQKGINVSTGPLNVSEGDYFTLHLREQSDTSITIGGVAPNISFMSLRVVDGSLLSTVGAEGGLWEVIEVQELTSAAASVDFTDIPAGYDQLQFVVEPVHETSGSAIALLMRFNSDSTANYDFNRLYGGTSINDSNNTNQTAFDEIAYITTASSLRPMYFVDIFQHEDTDRYTTFRSMSPTWFNGSLILFAGGSFTKTDAVNEVNFIPASGNLGSGTRIKLLGRKSLTTTGTAFPSTPTDGQRFYRTDLQAEYFWNATESLWLTTQLFTLDIPTTGETSDSNYLFPMPGVGSADVFFEEWISSRRVSASSTWVFSIEWFDGTSWTVIDSISTAGDPAGSYTKTVRTLDALVAYADEVTMRLAYDEQSGSAAAYCQSVITYRLVAS